MKLQIPKFKFNLKIFLGILLLMTVVIEAFILYQVLFLYPRADHEPALPARPNAAKVQLDLDGFYKVQDWIRGRNSFEIQTYDFKGVKSGRENPFADYR